MKIKKNVNGVELEIEITEEDFKEISTQRKQKAAPSKVIFELTMPKNNAWNSKWTGDDEKHLIIMSKGKIKKLDEILCNAPYSYDFGDGWIAQIQVRFVNNYETSKLRKLNKGFCGYDWMVKSIIDNGSIIR